MFKNGKQNTGSDRYELKSFTACCNRIVHFTQNCIDFKKVFNKVVREVLRKMSDHCGKWTIITSIIKHYNEMKCQVRHRRFVRGENVSIEFVITHGVCFITETTTTGKYGMP